MMLLVKACCWLQVGWNYSLAVCGGPAAHPVLNVLQWKTEPGLFGPLEPAMLPCRLDCWLEDCCLSDELLGWGEDAELICRPLVLPPPPLLLLLLLLVEDCCAWGCVAGGL